MKCTQCGTALTWGVLSCPHCGFRLGAQADQSRAPAAPLEQALFSQRTVIEGRSPQVVSRQPTGTDRTVFECAVSSTARTVFEDQAPGCAKTVFEGQTSSAKTVFEGDVWPVAKTVFEEQSSEHPRILSGQSTPSPNAHENPETAPAAQEQRVSPVQPNAIITGGDGSRSQCRLAGWLVCTEGSLLDRDYRVSFGKNTLGRHPECSILLNDNSVSSTHATIWVGHGKATLVDNHSRNGLIVNDQRIFGPIVLESRARIRVGLLTLCWVPYVSATSVC